jgi:glycosyltransferase involved in cell wall biosynthesis
MRVIVNAISAHTGGMVTYTSNLLRHLQSANLETIIYLPEEFPGAPTFPPDSPVRTETTRATHFGAVKRFIWEQTVWRGIVKRSGAHVVYSSANYGLLRPPVRQVLLVQGEISFNPIYRERVLPRFNATERALFAMRRQLVLWSAWRSDVVIFPSRSSMETVVQCSPGLAERCVVNHLATDQSALKVNHARPWRHDGILRILYVSVYYPHKDPRTLAVAARLLNESGLRTHAWITMEPGDFRIWSTGADELRVVRDEELAGHVSMGRLPHAQVGPSLASHDVLVFPSLAETFGFPLVEAMAAGVPLIAADTEIHREICGDAALYFELGNPRQLMDCLLRFDSDPDLRKKCVSLGEERVRSLFTWERHVRDLIRVFDSLA